MEDLLDRAPRFGAAERRLHRHVAFGIEAHRPVADVGRAGAQQPVVHDAHLECTMMSASAAVTGE
jgi:hypothetical protein